MRRPARKNSELWHSCIKKCEAIKKYVVWAGDMGYRPDKHALDAGLDPTWGEGIFFGKNFFAHCMSSQFLTAVLIEPVHWSVVQKW